MAGSYYIPLPSPEVPQNALLNFAPVNNALDTYREQKNTDFRNSLAQNESDRQDQELGLRKQQFAQSSHLAQIKRGGDMAMAIQNMADNDPAKAVAWQRYLKEFGDGNHSPEEMDFRTGPKIAAAAAGQYIDQLDQQTKRLRMQGMQQDLANAPLERRYKEAQIKALEQKDVLNEAIAGMLRGQPGDGAVPQSPIRPQSFDGTAPQTGMIPVADNMQSGALPQAPVMVDTPMGRMTADRAKQLGFAMSLAGKGDAGKMLFDAANGPELQKKTASDIEEKTMNAATQLGRLSDIEKRFDPKFLDIGNRMKMLGASWTAKAGGKLSPEIQSDLGRYAAFRSAAVNNLNTVLKEVSGAAVTPQEYERIQSDQPVAGTGIFDGDDPVSFKAKMQRTTTALKSAIARLNFMRNQGLRLNRENLDQFMALEDVPAAIDRRGAEIEQKLRQANPNADPMSIEQNVHRQLKQEFGI